MAPLDYSQWPVEQPSKDFAKRTVEAIVRRDWEIRRRSSRKRWVMVFALAAAFAASGAFAMLRKSAPDLLQLQPSAGAYSTVSVKPTAPGIVSQVSSAPAASSAIKPNTIRRVVPQASVSASASAVPSAHPRVYPRCDCAESDHVCSCIE